MAMFGSDWIQDDSSYDTPIGGIHTDVVYEQTVWDTPIGAPIHNEENYDSLKEYEHSIRHFGFF